MSDHATEYRERGYAIVRGVFSPDETAAIGAAMDRVYAEGVAHGRSFRHGNLFYHVTSGPGRAPHVAMVQWPSYHDPVLDRVRLDERWLPLLEPLIGRDIKQIINQLHWKLPDRSGDFAWHQDAKSRRPAEAYRHLATSYVQTGLAIDPHHPGSGGMRFIPRSHTRGALPLDPAASLGRSPDDAALLAAGLSPADQVDLILDPGDVALWSPYLVHASGTNTSDHLRRLYINGYVRAADCDRGEWAFRDGRAVPLGPEQALVHYEALRERPEPHFI